MMRRKGMIFIWRHGLEGCMGKGRGYLGGEDLRRRVMGCGFYRIWASVVCTIQGERYERGGRQGRGR